jgi:hypothetical protein
MSQSNGVAPAAGARQSNGNRVVAARARASRVSVLGILSGTSILKFVTTQLQYSSRVHSIRNQASRLVCKSGKNYLSGFIGSGPSVATPRCTKCHSE